MLVIGLTGGIGCGKSAAAELLANLGVPIVDTDQIAHQLTSVGQPALTTITREFGAEFLLPDGNLDRTRMRHRVFSEPAAKRKLEAILHPLIRDEVQRRLEQIQAPYVVVAIPLLLESGAYRNIVQRILVVDCSEAQQVARVVARNGLGEAEVHAIMAHQLSRSDRLHQADDILDNHGTTGTLEAQVQRLHQHYLKLAHG